MTELARRCEDAEGPDRNLDAMIHFAIKNGIGCGMAQDAPAYTSSLDAAMTLVPEGCDGMLGVPPARRKCNQIWAQVWDARKGQSRNESVGSTPALALCSAALRAGGENG